MFANESEAYYVFQCDKQTIYHNMYKIWYGDVRNALDVSCDLVKLANKVILEIRPLSSNQIVIPNNFCKNSNEYRLFIDSICELQKIILDCKNMEKDEQLAFFLNLYQVNEFSYFIFLS